MLYFITELDVMLGWGKLYILNHGNFVQHNTIRTYEKRLSNFFHNNASLGVVSYVTKLLENHFPNNVTNNINSTLGFQNYVLCYILCYIFQN